MLATLQTKMFLFLTKTEFQSSYSQFCDIGNMETLFQCDVYGSPDESRDMSWSVKSIKQIFFFNPSDIPTEKS